MFEKVYMIFLERPFSKNIKLYWMTYVLNYIFLVLKLSTFNCRSYQKKGKKKKLEGNRGRKLWPWRQRFNERFESISFTIAWFSSKALTRISKSCGFVKNSETVPEDLFYQNFPKSLILEYERVESNSVCNYTSDWQIKNRTTVKLESDLLILSMITEKIGRHDVLLLINKNYDKIWETNLTSLIRFHKKKINK